MISVLRRFSIPAPLTEEDRKIFLSSRRGADLSIYSMRVDDRRDAEFMYMLTAEAPGAYRQLLGLDRGEKIQKEETPANRSSGL